MKSGPYEVVFKKSALKEFEKLPARIQSRVADAVQLLKTNPYTELLQIKKLKGTKNVFRVRLQDYRLIYSIEGRVLLITIIKIGHRKEVYD